MFGRKSQAVAFSLQDAVKGRRITGAALDKYVDARKQDFRNLMLRYEDMHDLAQHRGWKKLEQDYLLARLQAIDSAGRGAALDDPVNFVLSIVEERLILGILGFVNGGSKEFVTAKGILDRIEEFAFKQQEQKKEVDNAR